MRQFIFSVSILFLLQSVPIGGQTVRGSILLAQNEKMYIYKDGKWKKWFLADPIMATYQIGDKEILYVKTVSDDDNSPFVTSDVDLKTGKLTPNPNGMSRLRTLSSGSVIYKQELDSSEAIYEYRNGTMVRLIQKHTPGFKGFKFLPNGSYMYQFKPEQIAQEGMTQLYFNNGSVARAIASNQGSILYARFINKGTHILWLRDLTPPGQDENEDEEEMEEDPDSGEENPFDDEHASFMKIGIESIELATGKSMHLGEFKVDSDWPDIAGQFVSWENSPNVAYASSENEITVLDATRGTTIKKLKMTGDWTFVQPLIRSFGGEDEGYALGSHLMIVRADRNKIQFLRNTDFAQEFEVPTASRDGSCRAAYIPD